MQTLSAVGSVSSILGLLLTLYVLYKEQVLQADMTKLKQEEEDWHESAKK
jgi:hypothetical protein